MEFGAGWDHSPKQREAVMNTHTQKKINPASQRHRNVSEGAPSLHLAAAAAHQWPEAIPVTKLTFPNGKTSSWQTVTYSQAHTLTKAPVSIF